MIPGHPSHLPRIVMFITLGVILSAATGCQDSHEAVAKDSTKIYEQIVKVLESVKDVKSAEKARDQLVDLRVQSRKLSQRLDQLAEAASQTQDTIDEQYNKQIKEQTARLMRETLRIKSLPPQVYETIKDQMVFK